MLTFQASNNLGKHFCDTFKWNGLTNAAKYIIFFLYSGSQEYFICVGSIHLTHHFSLWLEYLHVHVLCRHWKAINYSSNKHTSTKGNADQWSTLTFSFIVQTITNVHLPYSIFIAWILNVNHTVWYTLNCYLMINCWHTHFFHINYLSCLNGE